MTEREFWFIIRRALLMIVRAIEGADRELRPIIRRALLMIVRGIEKKFAKSEET